MLVLPHYRGISLVTATSGELHDEFVQTDDGEIDVLHGNYRATGVEYGGLAQSWQSGGSPSEVTGVVARLWRGGGTVVGSGLVRAAIYAHSGTFGSSSVPTGSPLVASSWYAIDSLTGSAVDYFFPMSGWTPDASTNYVVTVEHDEPFGTSSDSMRATIESGAAATHGGNIARKDAASAWAASSTIDLPFKVYYVEAGSPDDFELRLRDGTYRRRYGALHA